MAVVGVVLLDIYLLEAVLERAHTRESSLSRALHPQDAAEASSARQSPAAAQAAAAAQGVAGNRLLILRELAQSALAIVPRGASSVSQQAVFVGDDAAEGQQLPARPPLGLSTGSGHGKQKSSASTTLMLLDGLLPSRGQQQLDRENREWQQLRKRYKSFERGRKGQPAMHPTAAHKGKLDRPELPMGLQLPRPAAVRPLRPREGSAAGEQQQPLLQGPLPFVGLRWYSKATPDPAAQPGSSGTLPPDFDWRAYLDYNPDVRRFGVNTAELAAGHYTTYGHKEGRVYKRIPLIVRYTACGGLFNQHYSHVAALSIAMALGGDVILPAAVKRDSFANYFSQDPLKNQVSWTAVPFDTLWDAEATHEWLKGEGVDVAEAPDGAPLPDLRLPGGAFQHYAISGITPKQIVELRDVYLAAHDFHDLLSDVVVGLAHQAQSVARQVDTHQRDFPPLVLDIPCSLFTVATRDLPLAAEVGRGLRFAPALEALADKVVAGILSKGAHSFNGLHLRIERDAADWTAMMGGHEAFWGLYLEQAAAAGLDASVPLYLATGILSYKDADHQMEDVQRRLAPYSSQLVFKEQFLPADQLAALHPDQLALIDFLVLVRSRAFVGLSASTFSVFIREYRHLMGIAPRSTSRLVDCTPVGSEPLFARAAVLPPAPQPGEETAGAAAAPQAAAAAPGKPAAAPALPAVPAAAPAAAPGAKSDGPALGHAAEEPQHAGGVDAAQ